VRSDKQQWQNRGVPAKDVRELLQAATFQPSRHSHLLTPEQSDAYRAAGGGAAGRRAVLAVMDGGSTELELHREAWIAVRVLLTAPDDAIVDVCAAARERYLEASGERHVLPPPMGYGSSQHAEWASELEVRLHTTMRGVLARERPPRLQDVG
jgi:hypothetical protein